MDAAAAIALWWIVFAAAHSLPAHPPLRARLIRALGKRGYLAAYCAAALVAFVFLVRTFWAARHTGAPLWALGAVPGVRAAAIAVDLLAFALLAAALVSPSPVSLAGGRPEARGLMKLTRHPLFMAMAMWGGAHAAMNGYPPDVVFFGGFFAYGVLGAAHQDYRKRLVEADRFADFYRQTSLLPLGAVVTGRTRLSARELPWLAFLLGLIMGIGIYRLHPMLFW